MPIRFCYWKKLKAGEPASNSKSGPIDIELPENVNLICSVQLLTDVNNGFNEKNLMGRAGFGREYNGELHDGKLIAVKRMKSSPTCLKGLDELKSKVSVLTMVRHRHLVSLLGYFLTTKERIMVYEYLPQWTLSHQLFDWGKAGLRSLEWKMKIGHCFGHCERSGVITYFNEP